MSKTKLTISTQLRKVRTDQKNCLKDNIKSDYVKRLPQATHIQQEEIKISNLDNIN